MFRDESSLHEARAPGSPRLFGITMALVAAGIMVLDLYSGRRPSIGLGALVVALLMISWLRPALLSPANHLWLSFGQKLHKVTSLLILGALFFLVVTPLALLQRLFGEDSLALKRSKPTQTYWVQRDLSERKIDFEKPF